MKPLETTDVTRAFIDIGAYPTRLADGVLTPADGRLAERLVELVDRGAGFAVCYGAQAMLAQHGLSVHDAAAAEMARRYYEALFRAASASFDAARADMPSIDYDRIAAMDADGYNVNRSFTPNGDHTDAREFVTTKCVHFDAATPFIANLYGPYENISGGYPVICDTRAFCRDRGITPAQLVENIPNNYNVAVKAEFVDPILEHYSIVVRQDLQRDIVMLVLFNEVNGGVAHAATTPSLTDAQRPGKRPIRHIEYQFADTSSLARWYDFYRLQTVTATPAVASNVARYHRGETVPDGRIVDLAH
ncbi:hypothetical protein [Burkholderia ubonensis]|uniref:Uncharacterized protein n=1 Tax=Burkholderia ubonensis subsp. mesacidophila TaxID=265293 RepID=A0A2A4FBU7_9BURK|nr:hypothetical protein [Burkholderia ubonensis]PCE31253.1 hypothetical protein BZL54_16610 [Burkholderia ubonensis subsp. mesacidophila]